MLKLDLDMGRMEDIRISVCIWSGWYNKMNQPGYKVHRMTSELHKSLLKKLGPAPQEMTLLSSPELRMSFTGTVWTELFHCKRYRYLDDFLRDVFEVEENELFARFLFHIDGMKQTMEDYRRLASSPAVYGEYISNMSVSDTLKAALLLFSIDKQRYLGAFRWIFVQIDKAVDYVHKQFSGFFNQCLEELGNEDFIRAQLAKWCPSDLCDTDIVLAPSLLNPSLVRAQAADGVLYFDVGFDLENAVNASKEQVLRLNLNQIGKLLSEPKRCEIVDLLCRDELYMSQIANALDIPPNTTHYHMQMFMDTGAVAITMKGKRCLYRMNKHFFKALAKLANEYYKKLS